MFTINIILYSTGCPKCNVLEQKLKSKLIDHVTEHDIKEMMKLGYTSAPLLSVNGEILQFAEANNWINNYKE